MNASSLSINSFLALLACLFINFFALLYFNVPMQLNKTLLQSMNILRVSFIASYLPSFHSQGFSIVLYCTYLIYVTAFKNIYQSSLSLNPMQNLIIMAFLLDLIHFISNQWRFQFSVALSASNSTYFITLPITYSDTIYLFAISHAYSNYLFHVSFLPRSHL